MLGTAFIIFTIALIVSSGMWWEDYNTSLLGYLSLPSQKVTKVGWMVALLPQLIQMIAIYIGVGISNYSVAERSWYGIDGVKVTATIGFLAFLLDGYWDYVYKTALFHDGIAQGLYTKSAYLYAAVESWGLYGFGSELLGTLSFSMFVVLLDEGGFKEVLQILLHIAQMFVDILKAFISFGKGLLSAFGSLFTSQTVTEGDARATESRDTQQSYHNPSQSNATRDTQQSYRNPSQSNANRKSP